MTGIEWTDEVWNPTTGCDRISPGCDNCYALTMAKRLKGMGSAKYQTDGDPRTSGPGFGLAIHPDSLDLPLRWWRKPRRVFVNSMSDLFHEKVPDEFIARVWAVMALAEWHTFQVLTKRHGRLRSLLSSDSFAAAYVNAYEQRASDLWRESQRWADHLGSRDMPWPPPNVWVGVSAEDQKWADIRIPALVETPATVRFISAEPLLGPISFRWAKWHPWQDSNHLDGLRQLDWVIVGGESGPGARACELGWIEDIVNECHEAKVAVFVKQFGATLGREFGAGPHGADMERWPAYLQHRHFPRAAEAVPA